MTQAMVGVSPLVQPYGLRAAVNLPHRVHTTQLSHYGSMADAKYRKS
jgi:hypothetical protein